MRILLAAFKQETATFNPARSTREHFKIARGEEITALRATRSEIGGALTVLSEAGVDIIPTYAAWAVSGGPVDDGELDGMIDEMLSSIRAHREVDGALIIFHGAMAGVTEMDPEGRVLAAARTMLGDIPIVTTFDLHGVITDQLVEHSDAIVPFHTYPHVDQYETGQRGARCLLRLLTTDAQPVIARIKLPMLVRGDELMTATGRFGQAIGMCQEIEASERGLAAGVFIGNPFTDVPDLRSNVVLTVDGDAAWAQEKAAEIARFMWDNRAHFVAPLTPLDEAIRLAEETDGLTVFSDAADATSSGASGDSNAALRGLLAHNYSGTALLPLVDAPAVQAAFAAGIGSTIRVALGGSVDQARHEPLECTAYVKALSDGHFLYSDGLPGHAGPTAVLSVGRYTLMVTTLPVSIMDRHVFMACGLLPEHFDLVVCKSPNGFRPHYEHIARRIIAVDLPGSTSANLRSLPYERCPRPIFPLDEDVAAPDELA